MTVNDLFEQVNAAFRGSDDDAPTTGTDFVLWLATANRKQQEWARDSKRNWQSMFTVHTLSPTVTAGDQTYNLPATFLNPSDNVVVTVGTQTYEYTLVKPEERARASSGAYISGKNPQVLTFIDTIATGNELIGGTVTLGGWTVPSDLVDGDSIVEVDDPYWLVYATASELAFNDQEYSDKSPDLNAKANNLYGLMVTNNRRGTNNNPRVAPTNVNRIRDPKSEQTYGSSD